MGLAGIPAHVSGALHLIYPFFASGSAPSVVGLVDGACNSVGLGEHVTDLSPWGLLFIQEKQSRLASFQHRLRMCELAFQDAGEPSTARLPSDDRSGESYQRGPSNSSPRPPRVVVSDAEYRSWEAAVEEARAQTSPDTCPYVRYS